jgi:DNA polymerase III epsilon subunit-like protein
MADSRPDLYVSTDIETDGPIPGEFSILSFALVLASRYDGAEFEVIEPDPAATFYAELKPISDRFEPEALAVHGLDRDALAVDGKDPEAAMAEAAEWVAAHAGGARPVLVAYPLAFDWAFLYWYFIRFTGESPFGISACLDIRTLYQARALTTFDRSSQRAMPPELLSSRPHTHHAADDAQEQADLFNNIFAWALASDVSSGGP